MSTIKEIKIANFSKRLKENMPKGITQQEFADKVGVSVTSLKNWLNGTAGPTLDKIDVLAETLGKTIDWVITGKESREVIKIANIPIYDVQVSAGSGCFNEVENIIAQYPMPDSFFYNYGINKQKASGVRINGDSMEPLFNDGDIAIIDRSINRFEWDGIYAFSYDGYCYLKHLQMLGSELYAVSANKAYEKWIIDRTKEFLIVGVVKAALCKI